MNKKKWLLLSVIGTALVLIPRRSSRQIMPDTTQKPAHQNENKDDKNKAN